MKTVKGDKGFWDRLKEEFDRKLDYYLTSGFIEHDPICIPHQFSRKQDIEIAGFFAAIFAWGKRKTIIRKCEELMKRMDNSPYDFICESSTNDLRALEGFKHRTFNDTDLLYFVYFLKEHYSRNHSLESAFTQWLQPPDEDVEKALVGFHTYFFSQDFAPVRTRKHIATPARKSACKRLNMYLRWMVRQDKYGIDFGLWKNINSSQLVCPLDVHVDRVARSYGLLQRKQTDWRSAQELTRNLRKLDAMDPVKYDLVLFSEGVNVGVR